jgi:uncharacterized membrane-anchored protein
MAVAMRRHALPRARDLLSKAPQATLMFWLVKICATTVGATLGDTLTKPHAQGGFAFGRITASLAIGAAMVLLIAAAPSLRTSTLRTWNE